MNLEEKVWEEGDKTTRSSGLPTWRDSGHRKKYPPHPGTCATVSRTVAPQIKWNFGKRISVRIIKIVSNISNCVIMPNLDSSNGCWTIRICGCLNLVSWETPLRNVSNIASRSPLGHLSSRRFSNTKMAASCFVDFLYPRYIFQRRPWIIEYVNILNFL